MTVNILESQKPHTTNNESLTGVGVGWPQTFLLIFTQIPCHHVFFNVTQSCIITWFLLVSSVYVNIYFYNTCDSLLCIYISGAAYIGASFLVPVKPQLPLQRKKKVHLIFTTSPCQRETPVSLSCLSERSSRSSWTLRVQHTLGKTWSLTLCT